MQSVTPIEVKLKTEDPRGADKSNPNGTDSSQSGQTSQFSHGEASEPLTLPSHLKNVDMSTLNEEQRKLATKRCFCNETMTTSVAFQTSR